FRFRDFLNDTLVTPRSNQLIQQQQCLVKPLSIAINEPSRLQQFRRLLIVHGGRAERDLFLLFLTTFPTLRTHHIHAASTSSLKGTFVVSCAKPILAP